MVFSYRYEWEDLESRTQRQLKNVDSQDIATFNTSAMGMEVPAYNLR